MKSWAGRHCHTLTSRSPNASDVLKCLTVSPFTIVRRLMRTSCPSTNSTGSNDVEKLVCVAKVYVAVAVCSTVPVTVAVLDIVWVGSVKVSVSEGVSVGSVNENVSVVLGRVNVSDTVSLAVGKVKVSVEVVVSVAVGKVNVSVMVSDAVGKVNASLTVGNV